MMPNAALAALRQSMKRASLQALIIPSADAHNSEYVADSFKCRHFVTGFGGSAGTAIVTESRALLYTDGRYWLEAEATLHQGWELAKDGKVGVPPYDDWLAQELGPGAPVGVDARTVTMSAWERLAKNIKLVPTEGSLIAPLMHDGALEAPLPTGAVVPHSVEFAGVAAADKLAEVGARLAKLQCGLTVLSALDDIAWLFNLRGCDVPYNPVFYAYAVVKADGTAVLFTERVKLTAEALAALPATVDVRPYTALPEYLATLPSGSCCAVDEHQISHGICLTLRAANVAVKPTRGIVEFMKGRKNPRELRGMVECHVRDGVAVTRYIAWLKAQMAAGAAAALPLDEVDVATKLQEFREEGEHFVQLSFPTVSSAGPNGAIIHYFPSKPSAALLRADQLYLVDSGAQYRDGTTDVTRTLCFSAPGEREREAYTLVLKGHITINTAVFPAGVTGHRIDALARAALWRFGLDYPHGTGHGVGSYLNVHEGPHGIGSRPSAKNAFLEQGMICSNEPGYYADGKFGIRIENLEQIVAATTKHGDETWNTFKYLTMVPLEPQLIDVALLTSEEREWVNEYHRAVRAALQPRLEAVGDTLALRYLQDVTAPL